MEETFIFYMPSDFPRDDVVEIGRFLTGSGALVPSFIPAPAGLLNIEALISAKEVDGIDIQILPDRNLASRIALVAKQGIQREMDYSTKVVAHTMAFAQAMGLLFEPSIFYYATFQCEKGKRQIMTETVGRSIAGRTQVSYTRPRLSLHTLST